MTDTTTTPIQTFFEMQRQATRPAQQLFEQGIEIQQNATETFLRNGIAAQRSAQRQGTELAHEVTDAQIDAFESAVDENESEIRSAMDEQFERNAELTQEVLNAQFEQGAAFFRQLLEAQFDAFQSAVDGDDYDVRSTVDEQFEALADAQDDAWEEFEPEFLRAVDDLSEQQQVLLAESVEAFLDAHEDVERQTVEGVQQAQETAETAQQQVQETAESAQQQTQQAARSAQQSAEQVADEAADAAEDQAESQAEDDGQSLGEIEGLGSTYVDRLQAQGIDSLEDLTQAGIETVADAAEVSEDRASDWINAAQSQA